MPLAHFGYYRVFIGVAAAVFVIVYGYSLTIGRPDGQMAGLLRRVAGKLHG